MKKIFILMGLLFITALTFAQYRYFAGTLTGAQASTSSAASGVVIVRYDTTTRLLEHFGNFRGLEDTINNQHIHTGAPGVSGPVTIPLNRTTTTKAGGLFGSQVLTLAQQADLYAGNMYTNVHSKKYGGGEIRAQLLPTTVGQTEFLNARLQGAQSALPDSSAGSGQVNAIVDKATHTLYLTATYTNLTTNANNAHIHLGAVNVNGAVIIPLIFVVGTAGTLDTARVINTTDEGNILSGNTYVNVHSTKYGGGEIRGQLTQLSQQRFFAGTLDATQQVPANASTARGTVIVKYNPANKLLELAGDYQGLSTAAAASHIHQAPAGSSNPTPSINLTNSGGVIGTLTGSATLTGPQETDLLAGNMYVNIHTSNYPDGEIRAQLNPTTVGETQYFTDSIWFSQSFPIPTVASTGKGFSTVLLDRITQRIYVTASFTGLTSNITASHIHGGNVGVAGPVIIPLNIAGTTSGTVTGSAIVARASFVDSIINGFSYLNIHTTQNPGGEIRTQLGDLVLPVKLQYFNAYKDRDRVVLLWQTAEELNVKNFEIEERVNDNWITKETVSATGGRSLTSYKLNDVPSSNSGFVYYRLKSIDKDGRFTYSQVIRLNYLKAKGDVMILGNPITKGILRFIITGLAADKKAEYFIVDNTGKIGLKSTAIALVSNNVNISQMPAGVYKLVIQTDDAKLQQSFVK